MRLLDISSSSKQREGNENKWLTPSILLLCVQQDVGAKSVYDIINYDKVDCLVIDKEHFRSEDIFNEIVERAREKHVYGQFYESPVYTKETGGFGKRVCNIK